MTSPLDDLSGVRFVSACLKAFFILKHSSDVAHVSSCLDLGAEVHPEVICAGPTFLLRRPLACCSNLARATDV